VVDDGLVGHSARARTQPTPAAPSRAVPSSGPGSRRGGERPPRTGGRGRTGASAR
jgi:hypothetical protein